MSARLTLGLTGLGAAAALVAAYRHWQKAAKRAEQKLARPALQRRPTVLVRPAGAAARKKSLGHQGSAICMVPTAAEEEQAALGILVHGCHVEAEAWEEIVWGVPPHQLGRLPHAALLAWEERAHVKKVVCGTGASVASDGRLEGQYTFDLLFERLERLREFDAFAEVPMAQLTKLLKQVVVTELTSQNTVEEVVCGLRILTEAHCHRAVLVSSPTHLPRCLACACRVEEEHPDLFHGSVWASPSDTSYHNFGAGDVVVVEPPHRGDRDTSLDKLPFHQMVKRTFRIKADRKERFLEEFDELLRKYDV